jgi:hypothetical protein
MINSKLCECGCGELSGVYLQTNKTYGHVAGQSRRYIPNHRPHGAKHSRWNGGSHILNTGYRIVYSPHHSRVAYGPYVLEHLLIAEAALGRSLPAGVEVHHVNEIRDDNRNSNLVLCENHAYHGLLHQRTRAVRAGFPADWRKCQFCKIFDGPNNLYIHPTTTVAAHLSCKTKYRREYHARTGK